MVCITQSALSLSEVVTASPHLEGTLGCRTMLDSLGMCVEARSRTRLDAQRNTLAVRLARQHQRLLLDSLGRERSGEFVGVCGRCLRLCVCQDLLHFVIGEDGVLFLAAGFFSRPLHAPKMCER